MLLIPKPFTIPALDLSEWLRISETASGAGQHIWRDDFMTEYSRACHLHIDFMSDGKGGTYCHIRMGSETIECIVDVTWSCVCDCAGLLLMCN